ncbi:MAG: 3-phosphoshikimate 1-carboxyvinyltransferase [bacterium]|nr:3-phosphoshikimate 1-carboxyvinyltransferase [bacterium]
MFYEITPAKKFKGRWQAAGDKSLTHRAFIFNALAKGTAQILNANGGDDCGRTREILTAMGVGIEPLEKNAWEITGRDGRFEQPEGALDAGNSGTTIRLLAGLLAGQSFTTTIAGDESLNRRPMARIADPLTALGAEVTTAEGGTPPLTVKGGDLQGGTWESPVASAQVKSAFLLAALQAEGDSSFLEPYLSRDHSELMLTRMGIELEREEHAQPDAEDDCDDAGVDAAEGVEEREDETASARRGWIRLTGPQTLQAMDCRIAGDISSAAFLLAGGLLVEGGNILVKNVGVNPTRAGFLNVVERMKGKLALYNPREEAGEPVADILVQATRLEATRIEGREVPGLIDEIPILAVLAACAKGESRFHELGELRHKESDRLARTAEMITAFGGRVEVRGDGMIINGGGRRRGVEFDCGGDHRLAMAATIMALVSRGSSVIKNVDCVGTSFPEFAGLTRRFSGKAMKVVNK